MGRGTGTGLFHRTIPGIAEPNYLGRELLRPSSLQVLSCMAQAFNFGAVFNGDG